MKILAICEQERHDVEDGFASSLQKRDRRMDVKTANKTARELVSARWTTSGFLGLVSGKLVLSKLSMWTQQEFGVSFGAPAVVRYMSATDVHQEVGLVLRTIEEGTAFDSGFGRQNMLGA
jgi:hypothetical protein